jgi:hypothetical protein
LWDKLDGFTPELPDASMVDEVNAQYDAILAELKADPGLAASISRDELPLGGRTQKQWDLAQAFADSEWHEHALAAGWSWNELYGDGGKVWDLRDGDKIIAVSELRIGVVDRFGHAEFIYRDIDFGPGSKDDDLIWAKPAEPLPDRPLSKFSDTPKSKPKSEPTREQFSQMIGRPPDVIAAAPSDTAAEASERAASTPQGYTKAELEAARREAERLGYGVRTRTAADMLEREGADR